LALSYAAHKHDTVPQACTLNSFGFVAVMRCTGFYKLTVRGPIHRGYSLVVCY